jgi:hypothetical protein
VWGSELTEEGSGSDASIQILRRATALQSPTQTNGHLRGRETAGESGIERDRARGGVFCMAVADPFYSDEWQRMCVCARDASGGGGASQQL